jgi:hypothetical protein
VAALSRDVSRDWQPHVTAGPVQQAPVSALGVGSVQHAVAGSVLVTVVGIKIR